MDEATPAKPRLEFKRGRAASAGASPNARKHVPMEDALARMASKVGQRRRSLDEARDAEGETA